VTANRNTLELEVHMFSSLLQILCNLNYVQSVFCGIGICGWLFVCYG
jgi:hypothetical protein